MSSDVARVVSGLHPFRAVFLDETAMIGSRHPRIRRALSDAGVAWLDIQFAFAGSYEVDNPDAGSVSFLGLTPHPVHHRRYNGASSNSPRAQLTAPPPTRSGSATTSSASRSAWQAHLARRGSARSALSRVPSWYGELGSFLTRKFSSG